MINWIAKNTNLPSGLQVVALVSSGTKLFLANQNNGIYKSTDTLKHFTDTTAFTNSKTRLAYIKSGITTSWRATATPRGLDTGDGSEALPVAGDLLKCIVKTDSLIIVRAAGTTSGLKASFDLDKP